MKNKLNLQIATISVGLFTLLLAGFMQGDTAINPLKKTDIAHAEKLIGLEFSDVEQDSMLEGLQEALENYQKMRQVSLENSIPPAMQFNPIPLGKTFSNDKRPFKITPVSNSRLPNNVDSLAFYSIPQLAKLIQTRQITSEALTRLYLKRLKQFDPKLKCVVTLTEELALKQARRADDEIAAGHYRGLLHGIPYGVKDLLAVKGYPTTWGAMPYKNQVIDRNATVVKRLENAGAVLVAKLTMGALAWGDVWFAGKTRNPWNLEQGSSGSSAGPASATSAGLVAFSIGTETWGSIVSPSTRCAVTGLRPTYGRVSRSGAMALSWSMDKIGPICRSVEDCAIVFNAIYGPDDEDQTLYDFPFNYSPDIDIHQLRVGYLKAAFEDAKDEEKIGLNAALNSIKTLGIELVPIELPNLPVYPISFILSAESAAAFDELTRSNRDDLLVRQIKNAWPNVFRQSRFIPAVEYLNANRIRYQLIQEMGKLFEKIDVYIAPSFGKNLLLTNLTGHPCVVVPNGGPDKSISFIGDLFKEAQTLAVAKSFQNLTGFHHKHPKL